MSFRRERRMTGHIGPTRYSKGGKWGGFVHACEKGKGMEYRTWLTHGFLIGRKKKKKTPYYTVTIPSFR